MALPVIIARIVGWSSLAVLLCVGVVRAEPGMGTCALPAQRWSTSDHGKIEALKKDFAKPEEVTAACLQCHVRAASQIHKTFHWLWRAEGALECAKHPGLGVGVGKGALSVNNFCIATPSNEPRCTSCHIGFGWKDGSFDHTAETAVDCIVCHDRSGAYVKFPVLAGYPPPQEKYFPHNFKTYQPPDWPRILASIGLPTRANCGTCHFHSGDGDGVKHGDLDSSLLAPSEELDVHMAAEGADFSCTRCHTTWEHAIAGRYYAKPACELKIHLSENDQACRISCQACHGHAPHARGHIANDHVDTLACQSCHIPRFAREKPTKMTWDWSQAGRKNAEGKRLILYDDLGKPTYQTKKGAFTWAKNVVPTYAWYDGTLRHLTLADAIDPTRTVAISAPNGSPRDGRSRIAPFKIHRGTQPFDPVNQTLVAPKLFGPPGSGSLWTEFDWNKAICAGMAAAGLPYSGEYGFVETAFHLPINHMVAPKEDVVPCEECHAAGGRMAGIEGVYLPAQRASVLVDPFGKWAFVFALSVIFAHAVVRVVQRFRTRRTS